VTPAWQVRELARQLGARWTLRVLPSIYGHDAFLKEVEAVSRIVKDALCTEVAP
jgi:homoserine acetyltransferase